jgi:hypothetical protein
MLRSGLATGTRRAALAVLAPQASPIEQERAFHWLETQPAAEVRQSLARDHIDQLFLYRAEAAGLWPRLPQQLQKLLAARRFTVAAATLVQERVLDKACALLEQAGVEYLVFKGALLRRALYPDTYLRPCTDQDLLVSPSALPQAMRAFERCGYRIVVPASTHEVALTKGGVCIDLHWHLMRPGRMRWDVTEELLRQRVRHGGLWGPSDQHQTVQMLVHPAITEHVTGRLVLAADLDLWLRSRTIRWDGVLRWLTRMGLRTAAWTMLVWTQGLFDTPVPPDVWSELAPSVWRQRYLKCWLALDPAEKYAQRPWLVRGAFSLALQDRGRDSVRSLWMLWLSHMEHVSQRQ